MTAKLYVSKETPAKKINPNLSIVTCVLNGEKVLEETIKNVLAQKYDNFEYIVVYTLSNDSTWQIIKKYSNKIDKIIINDAVGIYQAFNVGLKYASGNWINYMNAGDYFKSKDTLDKIFHKKKHDCDILYSGCFVKYPNFKKYEAPFKLSQIKRHMPFSHQSSFVKLKIHKKNKFSVMYSLSGDYDLFSRLVKKKCTFKKINPAISISMAFGVADRRKVYTIYQNYLIAKKYWNINFKQKIFFYYKRIFISLFTSFIKIFIPQKLLLSILKKKFKK